jgi:hypothetical protein
MKRLILVLSVAAAAWMFSPTPEAQAWSWSSWSWNYDREDGCDKDGNVVPELDPGAAGSAMVLLLGGMAWIASRRRDEELA